MRTVRTVLRELGIFSLLTLGVVALYIVFRHIIRIWFPTDYAYDMRGDWFGFLADLGRFERTSLFVIVTGLAVLLRGITIIQGCVKAGSAPDQGKPTN